jgi:hypothetical protein
LAVPGFKYRKALQTVGFTLVALAFFMGKDGLHILPEQHQWRLEAAQQKAALREQMIQTPLPKPLIISSDDWNIRPEYALWFGKIMTPDNGRFNEAFRTKYPDVYFHKEGTGEFLNWESQLLNGNQIADLINEATVVIHRHQSAHQEELIAALRSIAGSNLNLKLENTGLRVSVWHFSH